MLVVEYNEINRVIRRRGAVATLLLALGISSLLLKCKVHLVNNMQNKEEQSFDSMCRYQFLGGFPTANLTSNNAGVPCDLSHYYAYTTIALIVLLSHIQSALSCG